MKKKIILVLLLVCLAPCARAEAYAKPTWPNLINTLIRFSAIDLNDDKLIDEYALITECDLYKSFYRDDFKWAKVRAAIRDSVRNNVATFPTSYTYVAQLQLDRYDFQDNLYRFTEKTSVHNVNTFMLYKVEGSPCAGIEVKYLPTAFRGVLDAPVSFDGLPLGKKDAEGLLQQMKADNNNDRVVYTGFNMHVVYIEPLRQGRVNGEDREYAQANMPRDMARLDMQLDSVDFYEDEAMTKLIYRYQP